MRLQENAVLMCRISNYSTTNILLHEDLTFHQRTSDSTEFSRLPGLSLNNPVMDYGNLLALTGYITQNPDDVEEMYRRMVFNYLVDNKDDHCKNFSFIVVPDNNEKWKWQLAPAYDLTLCTEGYNGELAENCRELIRYHFI